MYRKKQEVARSHIAKIVQGEMSKYKKICILYKDYSLTPWQFFWVKVRWWFWRRKVSRRERYPILDIEQFTDVKKHLEEMPAEERIHHCGTCGGRLEE